jgi:hypothetical protein
MRTELGIAGVTVLLILAGQGVLLGIGITRFRLKTLVASLGLAYLAGVAATMLLGILLLTLGVELKLPVFVVLALGVAIVGTGVAFRRRGAMPPAREQAHGARPGRGQLVLIGLAVVLLTAVLVIGLVDAGVRPTQDWDAWSIWTRKAIVLTSDGLDPRFFAGGAYGFAHLDYPILLPLFESIHFRAMGVADTQAIHACIWVLYVASLGAIAYLGSRITRIWVWLPIVLALAFGSQFYGQILTAYADVPMALLAGPGLLCIGLWLRGQDRRHLGLGVLLVAAAASTKNEGLTLAVATFGAGGLVLAVDRAWRQLLVFALGGLGLLVALAPWRIWQRAHEIKGTFGLGDLLDPGNWSGVERWFKTFLSLFEDASFAYIVPFGLVLVLVGLATPGLRRIAGFYLLTGLGAFTAVMLVFLSTEGTVYAPTTPGRVIMGTTFVFVAALLQLGGALDAYRAPADEPGDTQEEPELTPARARVAATAPSL